MVSIITTSYWVYWATKTRHLAKVKAISNFHCKLTEYLESPFMLKTNALEGGWLDLMVRVLESPYIFMLNCDRNPSI